MDVLFQKLNYGTVVNVSVEGSGFGYSGIGFTITSIQEYADGLQVFGDDGQELWLSSVIGEVVEANDNTATVQYGDAIVTLSF